VADQDKGRARSEQRALQPFDRGQIEVVGRLIEQEDVELGREGARQGATAYLATRKIAGVFSAGEAERL